MSTADSERSIGSNHGFRPNRQMGAIGWLIFLCLLMLLIPLLPVLILYWVVSKVVS